LLTLDDIGFAASETNRIQLPTGSLGAYSLLNDFLERIDHYDSQRDFPSVKGVSYLSVHLRFGTLSIREAVRVAQSRDKVIAII
jgi:deoxyribodipyrimidine photo-lyase